MKIVKRNLDAFAASVNDMGRTTVITHTIKTGDAKPLRHKLRLIPFAHRQYIEQEIKRLLAIWAIALAN